MFCIIKWVRRIKLEEGITLLHAGSISWVGSKVSRSFEANTLWVSFKFLDS